MTVEQKYNDLIRRYRASYFQLYGQPKAAKSEWKKGKVYWNNGGVIMKDSIKQLERDYLTIQKKLYEKVRS